MCSFCGKVWCWRTSNWPRTDTRHLSNKAASSDGRLDGQERCAVVSSRDSISQEKCARHVGLRLSNVHTKLDQARTKEVEQNRNRLHPMMVDTILTCSRQNIALRGHRFESEPLAADGEEQDVNDGHFRALLRYRIRGGDSAFSAHVMTAKGNATYDMIPFGFQPECDHISCWRSCKWVRDRQNKESEMLGVNRGRDDRQAQERTAGCRHTLCCAEWCWCVALLRGHGGDIRHRSSSTFDHGLKTTRSDWVARWSVKPF